MENYCIYKITSPSGKVYIGQSKNAKRRIKDYKYCKKEQRILYNSLKKYGYKNHLFEIIIQGLNQEEINSKEIELIKQYKDLSISLNIADGGHLVSNLQKKIVLQYSLDESFIQEWSSVSELSTVFANTRTISNAAKTKSYYSMGFLWIYKEDYEKGERPYWKYKSKTTLKRKVYQYDLESNLVAGYKSLEECARQFNVTPQTIKANILNLTESTQGFVFSYDTTAPFINKSRIINSKPIVMIDKEGNQTIYNSASECSKQTSLTYKMIHACLKGSKKSYKQFKFKFLHE